MTYAAPSGNVTDLTGFFGWINTTVDNWFFPGAVMAIFVIILVKMLFSTDDLGKSFITASFACMILTVMLRVINLVDTRFMVIFIILTAVGIVWMHMENSKYS